MPLTEGVIAGLLANGLTELIRYASPERADEGSVRTTVVEALLHDKELEMVLRKAIVSVAKEARFQGDGTTDRLQMFLISPEAEAVVRQIYGFWPASEDKDRTERALRDEFAQLMAVHVGVAESEVHEVALDIFRALLAGCELALRNKISKGVLIAHELKSARRFRLLLDELAAVQNNIALLSHPSRPDVAEITAFEDRYRGQLVERHSHITPPHFDVSRRIHVKDICVPARLIRDPK